MDDTLTYTTQSPEETSAIARALARELNNLPGPHILCLYGNLGSGKTTFTQAFAHALGIITRLMSPTFVIERQYETPDHRMLYHVDLYRLEGAEALKGIGIEELFQSNNAYILIEWAERLGSLLPQKRIDIYFETLEDGKHRIAVKDLRYKIEDI